MNVNFRRSRGTQRNNDRDDSRSRSRRSGSSRKSASTAVTEKDDDFYDEEEFIQANRKSLRVGGSFEVNDRSSSFRQLIVNDIFQDVNDDSEALLPQDSQDAPPPKDRRGRKQRRKRRKKKKKDDNCKPYFWEGLSPKRRRNATPLSPPKKQCKERLKKVLKAMGTSSLAGLVCPIGRF